MRPVEVPCIVYVVLHTLEIGLGIVFWQASTEEMIGSRCAGTERAEVR